MESIKKIIDDELAVASQNIYKRVSEIATKNVNIEPSFIISIKEVMNNPTIINNNDCINELKNMINKYGVTDQLDIGKCFTEKQFLLDVSSRIENLEMCKFLVENGADIDDSDALQYSACNGHFDFVKYLVENGADINRSDALNNSIYCGHIDIVKYLVEKGADINELNALSNVDGNLEIVKYLVEKGADINNSNALKNSVVDGHFEIVKYLVEKGADINSCALLNSTDKENVKYLKKIGVHLEHKNYVLKSVSAGHIEIVKYLVEKGAKFDSTNVILKCIKHGHIDILKYLLKKFSEQGIEIPDKTIDTKINDFNKILFMYAKETQENLFNAEIVTLCKPIKSLMVN